MLFSYLTYFSLDNFIPVIKNRLKIIYNFLKINGILMKFIRIHLFLAFYLGKGFWKSVDRDLIDNLGPNGMSKIINSISSLVSKMQSGFLYHYVLSIIVGLTLIN